MKSEVGERSRSHRAAHNKAHNVGTANRTVRYPVDYRRAVMLAIRRQRGEQSE